MELQCKALHFNLNYRTTVVMWESIAKKQTNKLSRSPCFSRFCRLSQSSDAGWGVPSQRSAALLAGVISPRCCPLVLLALCQRVRSFCLGGCRVRLCLRLSLLILSTLTRRVFQPLLVEASKTTDVDQVVVSGFVLMPMEKGRMKRNMRKQYIL